MGLLFVIACQLIACDTDIYYEEDIIILNTDNLTKYSFFAKFSALAFSMVMYLFGYKTKYSPLYNDYK